MELENVNDLEDKNRPKNARLEYHTKLDPKKKPKDTRNRNVYEYVSNLPSFAVLRKPKSENDIRELNGGANTFVPSGDNVHTVADKPVNENVIKIPSTMWWVPPLKCPSNYMPPSITVSARSYSQLSSVARPRVTRSAEDLQEEVISRCNVLEGIRYAKFHKCFQTMETEIKTECQDSNRDESLLVPPLRVRSPNKIPSQHTFLIERGKNRKPSDSSDRSSTESGLYSICPEKSSAIGEPVRVVEEFKNRNSEESPAFEFISLNGLVNFKSEKPSTSLGRYSRFSTEKVAPMYIVQECASETSSNSTSYKRIISTNPNFEEPNSSLEGYIHIEHVDQESDSDVSSNSTSYKRIVSPKLTLKKLASSADIDPFISVDDLANKHIIGPMTQKLAQLCTIQGNLYMDVLNDLKKSHEDFKNACKQRGLLK